MFDVPNWIWSEWIFHHVKSVKNEYFFPLLRACVCVGAWTKYNSEREAERKRISVSTFDLAQLLRTYFYTTWPDEENAARAKRRLYRSIISKRRGTHTRSILRQVHKYHGTLCLHTNVADEWEKKKIIIYKHLEIGARMVHAMGCWRTLLLLFVAEGICALVQKCDGGHISVRCVSISLTKPIMLNMVIRWRWTHTHTHTRTSLHRKRAERLESTDTKSEWENATTTTTKMVMVEIVLETGGAEPNKALN